MGFFVKLGFLIAMTSLVANAATVQGDDIMMVTEVDDGDGVHVRESRSPEGLGIPWYLDRINQRETVLDGKYDAFAEGKVVIVEHVNTHTHSHVCMHTMHA